MRMYYNPPYSHQLIKIIAEDFKDWKSGNKIRSLARWGFVNPPATTGKVLWIKAGYSQTSVQLATELLGAIRQKRIDIRIILTFEEDYQDIIEPRVTGLRKIGLGYGPAAHPWALKRFFQRINPFAVILVDTYPYAELLNYIALKQLFCIGVGLPAITEHQVFEALYPLTIEQQQTWQQVNYQGFLAEPADPSALFAESQIEPHFRSLANQGRKTELKIWLYIDEEEKQSIEELFQQWQQHPLAEESILCIFRKNIDKQKILKIIPISRWQRTPLKAKDIILVDDKKWLASIAASAHAIHCKSITHANWWQILAVGSMLSTEATSVTAFPYYKDLSEVLTAWQVWQPFIARSSGDKARQLFWQQRRQVQTMLDEFLERVFEW